jgi:hypothetical protein
MVALWLGACGADTAERTNTNTRHGAPSKASAAKRSYVASANTVCARYNVRTRALGAPAGPLARQAAQANRINRLSLQEIAALRRLPPPPEDRALLNRLFTEVDHAIRTVDRSTRSILRSDDRSANRVVTEGLVLLRRANQELATYGLTVCAE